MDIDAPGGEPTNTVPVLTPKQAGSLEADKHHGGLRHYTCFEHVDAVVQ